MIRILKKSILILLIIMMCFSITSFAKNAGWTYGDVYEDENGVPCIDATDQSGKTHTLRWDSNNQRFYVLEQDQGGYQGGSGTLYQITYDEYVDEKQGGDPVPTIEELDEKSESGSKKEQEKAQEVQEETNERKEKDQRAIEKSKDPSAPDVATGSHPGNNNSYYMTQIDGEWVIIMHYSGHDIVLHWNGSAFYADNTGESDLPTRAQLDYKTAQSMFINSFREKGMEFPSLNYLKGLPEEVDPEVEEEEHKLTKNIVLMLRQAIALWYYIFRYISIALMLVILIILGIKIAVASVGEKKAKYKKMLVDWFVGFVIIFTIHYLMIGIVYLNQAGINLIKDTANRVYSKDQRVYIVEDPSQYGASRYQEKTAEDLEISLYETVRTRAFDAKLTNGCIGLVFYACLVYFAYKFTFVYLKRILNIAILTIMAPLVAVSYALNKILTGRASIFRKWFKEYFTLVMIQFFHALVYVTFVMGTLKIALSSLTGVLFALILLKYMSDSEVIIRKIFGMDSNAIQDLAGTMSKGPTQYIDQLRTSAGIVIGVGAAGKMNTFLRRFILQYPEKWIALGPGKRMILRQARKDITDMYNLSDENLENSQPDRDYVDEILDYSDDSKGLTAEQQEMKDIVESEKYLDAQERGEELPEILPKYQTRYALDLAKAKLANNPKIVLAAARQRLHEAFDFRSYTERFIDKDPNDGSRFVNVRIRRDETDITKTRTEVYLDLISRHFSLKYLIGYTDEDMKEFKEGIHLINRTVGGFLGSVIAIGSAPDMGALSLLAFTKGIMDFHGGIKHLAEDNKVEFIPNFENSDYLSVGEMEALREGLTDELITRKDSYIVNSIARKHRRLARMLAAPFEAGISATTFPGGRLFRDVSKLRWEYLKYDLGAKRNELVKRRTELIEKISNLNRQEAEDVDATIRLNDQINTAQTAPQTSQNRREVRRLQSKLKKVEKEIIGIDKQIRKTRKKADKFGRNIAQIDNNPDVREFKEKHGHIKRSGGIGYAKREYVIDSTLKSLKAVNKVIRKEKAAYWRRVEEEARREREARNKKPINQFIGKNVRKGFVQKAISHNTVINQDGSRQQVDEEILVPVYTLDECIKLTSDGTVKYQDPNDPDRKLATEEAFEQWEKNYQEAEEERERIAAEQGRMAVVSNVEPPKMADLPPAPIDIKITLEDVKVAIVKAAAKKNKTVRKYELTKGNTNEVKKELFAMVKITYSIDGEVPDDVKDYIKNLDQIIAYAKATLIANELAAEAITKQIEENGKDDVDVNEAVEMVKASLKEYFEEVYNMPLPADLQRHDFIEDDTIIASAGYDTVDGLATKTMDKKLQDMANLIRVRNAEDEGSVTPETEAVINQLREKMRKSFRGESIDEQNERQDALLRLFHSDKLREMEEGESEEEEEEKEEKYPEDESDLLGDILDEKRAAEQFDQETIELVAEEAIASEEAAKEERALEMELPDRKGLDNETLVNAASELSEEFEDDETQIGDNLEAALSEMTVDNDLDSLSELMQHISDAVEDTAEEPEGEFDEGTSDYGEAAEPVFAQEPVSTSTTTGEPAAESSYFEEPVYEETPAEESSTSTDYTQEPVSAVEPAEEPIDSSSAVEDLLAGINSSSSSSEESIEEPVYEPQRDDSVQEPHKQSEPTHSDNKYGFYDDRQVTQGPAAQPAQNTANAPQGNTQVFNNEPEPVSRRDTTTSSETQKSESDFFKNRQSGGTQSTTTQATKNNQTNRTVAQPTAQPTTPNAKGTEKVSGPRVIRSDGAVQKSNKDGSKAFAPKEPVAEPVETTTDNNNKNGKNAKSEQVNPNDNNEQQ